MFPIKQLKKVYHIGRLDPSLKGRNSLEGSGLSISLHPKEWTKIAKLGGNPTYLLANREGKFLDFYKLTDKQKKIIADWGLQHGYLELKTQYKLTYFDGEEECYYYSIYEDEEKARYEYEGMLEDEVEATLETLENSPSATEKMIERVLGRDNPASVISLLSTIYVEDELDLDGVWWNEELDVWAYSAPRGVIVPSRVERWTVESREEPVIHF